MDSLNRWKNIIWKYWPETDTLTYEFVLPQISKSGSHNEKTMLRHNLELLWTLAHEKNPHPFPRREGQQDLLKRERITNAKTRIPNERNGKGEMKRNKRRKEWFPIKDRKKVKSKRSEESEKEKIGGKQNNSRSIFWPDKFFGRVHNCRQRKTHF